MQIEDKIKEAMSILSEVLEHLAVDEDNSTLQHMTMEEFKVFVGTKQHAMELAKKCKVGHSVFVEMVVDPSKIRLMRDSTRVKILNKLNIAIEE